MSILQESRARSAKRIPPLVFTAAALASLVALCPGALRAAARPVAREAPASISAADVPGVRHHRVRLSTQVELHVAEAGPPDGVPVVLLHGFTDSWFSWSRMLEHLPGGVRAIVPTHRGHGDSERPECCYRVADFAADVVALLDALRIERAHLVGHSMGGRIAQQVAIDHPARVDGLVLVSSAETANNSAVAEFGDAVARLEDPIDPAFVRDFQSGSVASALPAAFLDEVVRESRKVPARVWRETMAGMLAPDSAHDAARVQARTLIVWGDQDAFFPRAGQEALAHRISGARLLVYAGVGHSPSWETPERLLADVTAFLGVRRGPLLSAPDRGLERVSLGTGVELEVAQTGPRDGMPVLFLHGYSDSWFSYTPVLDRLPAGVRAIVPSQRGHGSSERPTCCYEIEDYAADALALLNALGIERAAIVGHSMGSFVAQRLALDHPERVSRLVLIGSSSRGAVEPLLELEPLLQGFGDAVPRDFVRDFQESTVAVPVPRAFLDGVIAESGKLPVRVWRDALAGLLRVDVRKELPGIMAPTLLVWGEEDGLFSRTEQDLLLRSIAGARLQVYPRTGHTPHWERPERFVEELREFLRPANLPLGD